MFDLSNLLNPFFKKLTDNNIKYCILRGYQELPKTTRYDIDISIKKDNFNIILSILKDSANLSGWKIVGNMNRDGFCRILLFHPEYEKITLPIDFIWKHHYRGLIYADNNLLLDNTMQHNNINIAHLGYESAISFVGKMIVGKGKEITDKKRIRIQTLAIEDKEKFVSLLNSSFEKKTVKQLFNFIQSGEWENAISMRRKLIKEAINRLGYIKFLKFFTKSILESAKGRVERRGKMNIQGGLFIVLLGPDGSGKTTLAKELDKELKPIFNSTEYYHGRFNIFPQLGNIKRLLYPSLNNKTISIQTDTTKRPRLSTFRASANIIYYGLEYAFAKFSIFLKLRKNTLIISDRYFYDYFLHPEYRDAPKWLILFFTKVIPKPDILLLIKCNPEIIFERKKELSLEEISRQQKLLETFENFLDNSSMVNTNQSLKKTLKDAMSISLKGLNNKKCIKKLSFKSGKVEK